MDKNIKKRKHHKKTKRKSKKKDSLLYKDISFRKRFYFDAIESIYLMIDSGQDILTAVTAAKEDSDDKSLKALLGKIGSDLKKGAKFWEALTNYDLIPQRFIKIIKVGEDSGILHETLNIVIKQYEHESDLKSKIRSASIYPIIVLSLTLIIGLGISWFILPQLASLYTSFGTNIPFTTQILVSFGAFTQNNGYWFIPSVIAFFIITGLLYRKVPKIKLLGETILLQLPGFRQILLESEISRMGHILGNLLKVGISIDTALDAIQEATPRLTYQKLYQDISKGLVQGNSFSQFFNYREVSRRIMPSSIKHLITAGEKSGNLPNIFMEIGNTYKERMATTSENLEKVLEPALLIIMFIFVTILAIGVITPIYSQLGHLDF